MPDFPPPPPVVPHDPSCRRKLTPGVPLDISNCQRCRDLLAQTARKPKPDLRSVPDELVTREELARIMRVSVRTIQRMRREGMPSVTWGRALVRFRVREAIAWAEKRQREAA